MTDEDPQGDATIRSEERIVAGTETVARERVRLQRYIVSEERTVTVTVRREEVRMVRERMDDVPVPAGSPDSFDEPITMVLSEERVELVTTVVPRERVWLQREVVTERVDVTEQVRREQVDVSGTGTST